MDYLPASLHPSGCCGCKIFQHRSRPFSIPPLLLFFIPVPLLFSIIFLAPPARASASPEITAKAAVIIDLLTGEVLFARNPHLRLPPASTTKIMTALIALEMGRFNQIIQVSKMAASAPASKVYLRENELITLHDLLYAILLNSANDASVALAEGLAGSEERFAQMMTQRAKQLGALNTNFTNASGLPAEDHYSTAYDMATLMRYAVTHNTDLSKIMMTKTAMIGEDYRGKRGLRNHNKLLWSFEGARGGKTGYTKAAQHCFVGSAKQGDSHLIVALLGSRNLWSDVRKLLAFGFDPPQTTATVTMANSYLPQESTSPFANRRTRMTEKKTDLFTVQIGSFKERKKALILQKKVEATGHHAYLTSTGSPRDGIWYKVKIGRYKNRKEAEIEALRLQNRYGLNAMITSVN
ncbi:MAG: D-alanyl-D-alanine carboxypeptidase [Candidatus Tectomicrobia bacterium]|nr:D-alanyl-D-alanine carboxypeptidase [Candidatus Tectomicrobia bacterium]